MRAESVKLPRFILVRTSDLVRPLYRVHFRRGDEPIYELWKAGRNNPATLQFAIERLEGIRKRRV
jgi:hypothetical protein